MKTPRLLSAFPAAALVGCLGAGLIAAAPASAAPTPATLPAETAAAASPVAAAAAPAPGATTDASRFTLAVLPDTQFYSRYSADQFIPRYGDDPFSVQTDWLAKNADALQIPFVTHLGDVVDRVGVNNEWIAADNAMKNLDEAKLPYSILAGNHDVRDSNDNLFDDQYNLANEPFLKWFGPNRAQNVSTFQGSDPTGFNQFHIFEADGQKYMVLALSWRASDATLAWAADVMAQHPTVPVILTTHQVIDIAPDGETPRETDYGLRLWDKLIKNHDQIFLTLNGHFHGSSRLDKTNDFGHTVTEVVIDYQMAYEGGDGYLGLYEFDLTNDVINVQTASPWVTWKPQETLTSYDQPFLEGSQQQFSLPIDFSERFKGFNPTFAAGPADTPSLGQKARDILLDGFVGPDPITTEFPGSPADYPEVPGTLAHWQFNGLDGVVGTDVTIPDVAGDGSNDLHRADPTATNSVGTELSDVTIESDDVHGYSADQAGACFTNSSGSRYSYLTTDKDAPVNNADLSKGYTIETFVKMSPEWTPAANQWSKFLTHTGNRSKIDGFAKTQWDWTASPTALGISNLREFQWTTVPGDPTKGDRTNWSGEIMVDSWSHVAVVSDAEKGTITMYVDGAPVLRNAVDAAGISANPDMPWIIGSDWVDDAARNGWNGCVGETRIIDHATGPAEWLTSRADLTGFTVTDAPSGTLQAGSRVTTLSGTGLPGAEVRIDGGVTDAEPMTARVESNARVMALDAATVVAEDGTWSYSFPTPLTASGSYSYEAVQALGTRASDPVTVAFAIAAAPVDPTPTPAPTPGTPGDPSATPAPVPAGPNAPGGATPIGQPGASDGDADLAETGVEPIGGLFASGLILLIGACLLLLQRSRRARLLQ
ncbi:LamG-like jellyroll fold domain-containing protein [Leifsonia sp. ALI-44-B]|uniref:LamG-like jellyroll fold domain-containing protein n=1 Tax=Leifsonia sp. ALI-44-B TaxID=1933776 RepID=UPI00193112E1|nr:LamG-like jellyroll fold domain-containing protein [Leifsonia sp. ALI-44-B]